MSLAIESTLPGVTAIVNAGQVARPLDRQPTSTFFCIGFAAWGPHNVPVTVTSWQDFVRKFGSFDDYLADAAYIFFNHYNGKQMVVVRAASLDQGDFSAITVNNRVPAVATTILSKYFNRGVDITVNVVDTALSTTKVTLTVTSEYLGIKEVYENFDNSKVADVNSKSKLIQFSAYSGGPTASNRLAAGDHILTGGSDNREFFGTDDLGVFTSLFADEQYGTGQVAIPGYLSESGLIAHAEATNRLALLDVPLGTAYESAVSINPSSFAATYYSWVEMKSLDGSGVKKFYPPSIFAAGECAKVDQTIGTHKAPANNGTIPLALDVERNTDGTSVINDGVRAFLNSKNVNVIAPISGQGIKIYGARVQHAAGDTRVQFVHERRMLNMLQHTFKLGYSWAVFAVVDGTGRFFRDLRSTATTFLNNLWKADALYGKTPEEAFTVIADESNNPPEELALGRVHVQIGVKLSPTAEQIIVNIDSVSLSQDLSVLQN
jgi:uncharacterized protein